MTEPDWQQRIRAAADKLQPHYFKWMISAAKEHFEQSVQKNEREIIRHVYFADERDRGRYHHLDDYQSEARKGRIVQAREDLERARDIVEFLQAAEDAYMRWDSERFAAEIAEMFKARRQR